MVTPLSLCCLALVAIGLSPDNGSLPDAGAEPSKAVRSALSKEKYPWYDSEKDAIKPMVLPPVRQPSRSTGTWAGLGSVLAIIGFMIALGLLIAVLVWFWKIYEPGEDGEAGATSTSGGMPSNIESLPLSMRREFESSDPWAEAIRRRARGDLSGAVVCLFAHQLLTLSRISLVRLSPGRTGRQLLRSVSDVEFRGLVQPTLRQFEAVYYGHRTPSAEEFAEVWRVAEAFERRVAAGAVS